MHLGWKENSSLYQSVLFFLDECMWWSRQHFLSAVVATLLFFQGHNGKVLQVLWVPVLSIYNNISLVDQLCWKTWQPLPGRAISLLYSQILAFKREKRTKGKKRRYLKDGHFFLAVFLSCSWYHQMQKWSVWEKYIDWIKILTAY